MLKGKLYSTSNLSRRWPRRFVISIVALLLIIIVAMVAVRQYYYASLKSVSKASQVQSYTVEQGATVNQVADELHNKKLIRSSLVFQLYVRSQESSNPLIAGTYSLGPRLTTPQIVAILSGGKVATDLVTILPGQRLDQIRQGLIDSGFSEAAVDQALEPAQYADNPALVDKPAGASLEGYLYPESFQRTATTQPKEIITASLDQMNQRLTPEVRAGFTARGLNVYQGITLASIVEQEASKASDRRQIAQVFLSRLGMNMALQSDPTAKYGAILDGQEPTIAYQSPYNTYVINGLTPSPISNVSEVSLQAVVEPAGTDWVYFVSGDDGTTHFSRTLVEHEQLTAQYCTKLCSN